MSEPAVSLPVPRPNANPWKSPTYPQRVHVREKAQWVALLKELEEKVSQAGRQLGASPSPAKARLYAQMQGAIDQIADSVRRLPGEVGDLYEEDKHRLEEAKAALERLFARWGGA